jgi:hypothetical protein
MANQSIGIGSAVDDGTGDTLRVAIDKVNDNFLEIYTLIGDASSLTSGISATATVVTLATPTITGTATMADLDISGDVDIDGTLEADAITIDGVTLAETISDTVGAMVGSNTETGITVSYVDGDNTLDFVMGTTQSTITSLTNAALVVGRDADNDIDFATDNNIIFRAGGADQIKLIDGAIAPVTDNDIDLGTSSLEFKDAFFDGTVTSDAFVGPLTGEVTGNASTATILATARTIGGTSFNGSANIAVALSATATALATARTIGGTSFDGTANIAVALASVGTAVTVADESSDTTCFPLFATAATGDLPPKSGTNLTFNSSSGLLTATLFAGALTGNVTGNASGTAATVTGAAQTAITSVGTLTALQVDNLNINGNTLSSTAGTDLLITPLGGQQIVLDGAIIIDAGVVTGATSITSSSFVGALTGNASGTAATVTGAAQTNITSVGTLTALQIDNLNINGNTLSSTAGTDLLITPLSGQQIVLDGAIIIDAGVVTGATSITSTAFVGNVTGNLAGTVSTATQNSITTATGLVSVGALNSGSITSGFTSIDVGAGAISTTGAVTYGSLNDGTTALGATAAELNILDASAGNVAAASDVATSAGAVTSNNAKISHTITLNANLADDAIHADIVVTSDKCLATSVVMASSSLAVGINIHTIAAGSFKVSITNLTGAQMDDDSTLVVNYRII